MPEEDHRRSKKGCQRDLVLASPAQPLAIKGDSKRGKEVKWAYGEEMPGRKKMRQGKNYKVVAEGYGYRSLRGGPTCPYEWNQANSKWRQTERREKGGEAHY